MLRNWLLAARPKTLSAGAVPVMIGSALAAHEPPGVTWWVFGCALAGALLIQIATNLINDALDFKRGADNEGRLGPLRVTQAGLISYERVIRAAIVCLLLAALCGVPLIFRGGWPILLIGLGSIAGAYLYTGGPYPLAYHGMGEVFVMLFFGLVAVGGTFYAHSLQYTAAAFFGGITAGSLATVLLVVNNLRDAPNDLASRKRTLVVVFGERFAKGEIAFFSLLPFATVAAIARIESRPALLVTATLVPVAGLVLAKAFRARGAELNGVLALAGAYQWSFGILFVIGSMA